MSIREVCNIVYEQHKDLFDNEEEVFTLVTTYLRRLKFDVEKLQEKEYHFGKTIVTESGKKKQKAAMKQFIAKKDIRFKRWKLNNGVDNWKSRRIDIYFEFC